MAAVHRRITEVSVMKKSIALAILILFLAARALAVVIEIPLPELLGNYQNTQHTVTLQLPAPPAVIHSASFRVSGTTTQGVLYCDDQDPPSQSPLPLMLYAELDADDLSFVWFAENHNAVNVTGAFSWTAQFHGVGNPNVPTWSFLMDGVTNLRLVGADPGTWCLVTTSPSAVITEAVFIIDAEFPIAAEPTTWGRVKALYR
jgi:hypothetical protein